MSRKRQKRKEKLPIKKIGAIVITVVIIGVVLWNAPAIYSAFQNFMRQSSYTEVTVEEGQIEGAIFYGIDYGFAYRTAEVPPDKFAVFTVEFEYEEFPLVEGAVYTAFGIEILVSEVHSDYIVLLIRYLD